MIKGVNRRIIEVLETGSPCFDRAIFFVKNDFGEQDEKSLQKEARRIIKQYNVCDLSKTGIQISKKEKQGHFGKIFLSVLSAFIGAMVLYIVQILT